MNVDLPGQYLKYDIEIFSNVFFIS